MYKVNNLYDSLLKIFSILSFNPKLNFLKSGIVKINTSTNSNLVTITNNDISIPVPDFFKIFTSQRSNLENKMVDFDLLQNFIAELTNKNQLVRLNHVGFCYKVLSSKTEIERILGIIKKTKLNAFEEPSNDYAKWLFIGDLTNWSDPLIELLPVEESNDKWIEYWLPHIQIDIDTLLTPEEMRDYAKTFFHDQVQPFNIVIDGTTYIVRCRLGVIDGVNINLDLATKHRNVKSHRENILKKLV